MQKEKKAEWKGALKTLSIVVLFCVGIGLVGAYVSNPTISDAHGWQWGNITIGEDTITSSERYGTLSNFSTGRTATFVVAASDSFDSSKQQADYVCDGIDDQVEIQAAIVALSNGGGKVLLLDGKFFINDTILINKDYVDFSGIGFATELFLVNGVDKAIIKVTKKYDTIHDMTINGNRIQQPTELHAINLDSAGYFMLHHTKNIHSNGDGVTGSANPAIITNNFFYDCREDAIHPESSNWIITNNWCEGYNSRINFYAGGGTRENFIVSNNVIKDLSNGNVGIYINAAGNSKLRNFLITNNHIINPTQYGILINKASGGTIKELKITENSISDVPDGVKFFANIDFDSVRVEDNMFSNVTTPISGIASVQLDNAIAYLFFQDIFMDVLAVSATHIRSNEDLSVATPITFTIDAQPDVPRTLSAHFDSHVQITEYDIEIIGTDAKGNTVTETKDETDGWDWETSNAFGTITSIKMTARTGTGAGDTMDIGITDVIGFSNIIYATGDVFKIKKNNTNVAVVAGDVSTTYGTYDMHTIGLAATDDYTIWYKSNLNIVS